MSVMGDLGVATSRDLMSAELEYYTAFIIGHGR